MKKNYILTIILMLLAVFVFCGFKVEPNSLTSAKSACLMEAESGRVFFEKDAHSKRANASTTKILTAIVVLENAKLDDIVTIPKSAVGVAGSSIYLRENEHLTVEELLYGMLLQSGNDASVALALHVGHDLPTFIEMMNAKAKEIGAVDTNFLTPHGLPCENHFTTAYDLALISCYAMKNDDFVKISSTKSKTISNEGFSYKRNILNKNKILSQYEGANGGKTGYTVKAGRCFVGTAKRNGMQLVAVVLNCGPMFEDSMVMLDYGFKNFDTTNIIPTNKMWGSFKTQLGKNVLTYSKEQFNYPLAKKEIDNVKKIIKLDTPIYVQNEQEVGVIEIYLANQLIFSSKLYTIVE